MSSRAILMVIGLTIAFQLLTSYKVMRSTQALIKQHSQQIEALSHE
jgi:hypothetical protein